MRSFRFAHSLHRSTTVMVPRLRSFRPAVALVLKALAVAAMFGLVGCLADTPEDSDLPWASNKNWEGIAPIAPSMMDRYD